MLIPIVFTPQRPKPLPGSFSHSLRAIAGFLNLENIRFHSTNLIWSLSAGNENAKCEIFLVYLRMCRAIFELFRWFGYAIEAPNAMLEYRIREREKEKDTFSIAILIDTVAL